MKKRVGQVTPQEAREQSKADKANWRRKTKQPKEKSPIKPRKGITTYSEGGYFSMPKRAIELLKNYEEYKFPDGSGSKFTPRDKVFKVEYTPGGVHFFAQEYEAEVKETDTRTEVEKFVDGWKP